MSAWKNVFFIAAVTVIVEAVSASLLFVLLLLHSIVPLIKKIEIEMNRFELFREN